jgi:hypothetical protein
MLELLCLHFSLGDTVNNLKLIDNLIDNLLQCTVHFQSTASRILVSILKCPRESNVQR